MSHFDSTAVERIVEAQGPLTIAESPYNPWFGRDHTKDLVDQHDRVRLLWPTASSQSQYDGSFRPGQAHNPVLYSVDQDPERVIRYYLDENPKLLEYSSSWAIYIVLSNTYNQRTELLEAAEDVLSTEYSDGWQ